MSTCPTCGHDNKAPKNPVDPFPVDYGFDKFWEIYPKRNGKRVGKMRAKTLWCRLGLSERRQVYRAATNYAAACNAGDTLAKDPPGFFSFDYWCDWLEKADPVSKIPQRPAWVPAGAQWDASKAQWVA